MSNNLHLITSGCSFTEGYKNWPTCLTAMTRDSYSNYTLYNVACPSQGQDLIQKKAMYTASKLLESIPSNEILLIVMWSGINRSSWYITNPLIIDQLANKWRTEYNNLWSFRQFSDLEGHMELPIEIKKSTNVFTEYNQSGGWYVTTGASNETINCIQEFYNFEKDVPGIGAIHRTLENIVLLDQFCKIKGIKIVHQFYMDSVYKDIVDNRDHQLVKYLLKQLDHSLIIKEGMYEYLKEQNNIDFFKSEFDFHPSLEGSKFWVSTKLLPFLKHHNLI